MNTAGALVHIDVHLGPEDVADALRSDVRAGLTASPKVLSPKWFYDDLGCALFEAITRLPEYYPTRRERRLLLDHSQEIAHVTAADTLIELGSGTSEKTRVLLAALWAADTLERFVPFDVSETTLRAAGNSLAGEYPGLEVHGVVGDFEHHIPLLPRGGRRLIAFLGSTIGNLEPHARRKFLRDMAETMHHGDWFLLGIDLVKDVGRLEAAYNDIAGVTAAFNRNILSVINRGLDANFDLMQFEHVARFNVETDWIEMFLRSRVAQRVELGALGLTVEFEAGEHVRTEISTKFRRHAVRHELAAAGLDLKRWWTDAGGDFALLLATEGCGPSL